MVGSPLSCCGIPSSLLPHCPSKSSPPTLRLCLFRATTLPFEDSRKVDESGKTELKSVLLDSTWYGSQLTFLPFVAEGWNSPSPFTPWVLLLQEEHHWNLKILWVFPKMLSNKFDARRLLGRHGWESGTVWGNSSSILKRDQQGP